MSEAANSVGPVHDGDSEGVETASRPAGESAGNAAGDPERQDGSEPHAAAHPPPDPVAALAGSVSELAEQVRAHHTRAHARERVIDQLHAEVERLRAGERASLLRPVVTDLQRLRADLLHHATTLSQIDQRQAAALLESFALSVELTLERCAILPIRPSVGARFSAREHRAVTLVAAESPDEDGTVALVVAEGYVDTSTDRVTMPARVHVRRWTPPAPVGAAEANRSERQENNADV
ncbi:MAG: nucleotide exchange factor GrpE [Pseudonocardiales bacterium]|nr:nucleotide exchange factor GrpE [Pseudonocardiales bacterium]MBV9031982.1 nucleotide exchange factor GrpE [Pseudonocardiales bacterium]